MGRILIGRHRLPAVLTVFATFGDARLPAVYHGDDSKLVDSHILTEVQAAYAALRRVAAGFPDDRERL